VSWNGVQLLHFLQQLLPIADNALVAITLMSAASNPAEKETMVKLIVNLINSRN
jgi:hypothetical protein